MLARWRSSARADPNVENFAHATILRAFGTVPENLDEL
jgi:hypothetical protein